jgi:hypothetical protein
MVINPQSEMAHLDLGPQHNGQKGEGVSIGEQLGSDTLNYEITWRWVKKDPPGQPLAFFVQDTPNRYYFRLGLMLPFGVISVYRILPNENNKRVLLVHNGPQAQYVINDDLQSIMSAGGLDIAVDNFSSKNKCFHIQMDENSQWKANTNEKYYKAKIERINCP